MSKRSLIVYHIISCLLLVGSALIGAFVLRNSYIRLYEAGRDLGTSFVFYFCTLFGIETTVTPTVCNVSSIDILSILPFDLSNFKNTAATFGKFFISFDNFKGYFNYIFSHTGIFLIALTVVIYIIVLVIVLIKVSNGKTNNDYGKQSLPLHLFLRFTAVTYIPIKNFFVGYREFLRAYKAYVYVFVILWVLNVNVVPVVLEALAYLFYFVLSFDILHFYVQLYKLLFDLSILFGSLPFIVWVILAAVLFDRWRKNVGYANLQHCELCDRGFINSLPICVLIAGTTGLGKTTILTDMGISQAIMFRQKAYDLLLKNDMRFHNFPWIIFERNLLAAIDRHEVYTLATCKKWVNKFRKKFVACPSSATLFGYDIERNLLTYKDGLTVRNIFSVLSAYAQEFFIYVVASSLIISNYSVRDDDELISIGNFPRRYSELFRREPVESYLSRHSAVFDFNCMRFKRVSSETTSNADYLEYGALLVTEISAERGNSLENKNLEKDVPEANAVNDGMNKYLKTMRQGSMVDNVPFLKFFVDSQRPEDWGAVARDLCTVVHIDEKSDEKLAMPFFMFGDWLFDIVSGHFKKHYEDFRYRRGDNTLFMYLYKGFYSVVARYHERIVNTFGYRVFSLSTELGTLDGQRDSHKYYLCNKKIYSDRFATDAFGGFFEKKALRSKVGLVDQPHYTGRRATLEQLNSQHSYNISSMQQIFSDNYSGSVNKKRKKK